ncbi:hypothetical protein KDL29_03075 [bacterium]|nr:hypothetical protein [bacterium]
MADASDTPRASLEQQVFGEMDRRSFGLSRMDSADAFINMVMAMGLTLAPMISLLFVAISLIVDMMVATLGSSQGNPQLDGLTIAALVLAVLAPVLATLFLTSRARAHLDRVRSRLKQSDIAARLMHGWRVEYHDGPLAGWLRSFELLALRKQTMMNHFIEAFRQLDYCIGLRKAPWPPMIVNLLLIWLCLSVPVLVPLSHLRSNAPANGSGNETFMIAVTQVVLAVIITWLALPVMYQLVQQSLLREHLRDLDNERLESAAESADLDA